MGGVDDLCCGRLCLSSFAAADRVGLCRCSRVVVRCSGGYGAGLALRNGSVAIRARDELGAWCDAGAFAGDVRDAGRLGAQGDERCGLPVPESPIRHSGSLLATQSQTARVLMIAGSTAGLESKSKSRSVLG
jgi:hypothetical protein